MDRARDQVFWTLADREEISHVARALRVEMEALDAKQCHAAMELKPLSFLCLTLMSQHFLATSLLHPPSMVETAEWMVASARHFFADCPMALLMIDKAGAETPATVN